ncbi:PhzF family phenazine biosynthesis protein [Dyella telluris]|uniref:PhzF family phenazine biosynthesis protein n=1 Tax=Dyella telluris TaxID=2763498 RepID=A0A7G8Q1N8_9GAMM|nr:PhzF family phenazine biosynthesis protein [Dyella telluris]QNK00696.1 PhzF family phenazine biosynthesis protein [Dyella telluris]
MLRYAFKQVDVFAEQAFKGNPVAVILGADGLSDDQMAAIARWTNLSETTFVLKPTDPSADYRVRIFTTVRELPFAGHPTLGTCHAWLEAGGVPRGEEILQECGIGKVRIRRLADRLAFTAPPLLASGALPAGQVDAICTALGIDAQDVMDAQQVDNGAGWVALRLSSPELVLRITPDYGRLGHVPVGIFAAWPATSESGIAEFEARAFIAGDAVPEDPVTGSLMAGIAQWLRHDPQAPDGYIVNQGRMLGRAGRIHVDQQGEDIWISGQTHTLVDGVLSIPLMG